MTGRFASLATLLLTLTPLSADAQTPGVDAWCPTCPPGVHSGGSHGLAGYHGHAGYSVANAWSGKQPATRPYQPGAARWGYEDLGQRQGPLYGDSPLDEFLRDVARDSYFRMEFLSWSYRKPGNVLLGSPLLVTDEPAVPFSTTLINQLAGTARVETLGLVKLEDIQGGKMTLGVPFTFGTVEASIFSFENAEEFTLDDTLGLPDPLNITQLPTFVATSTLLNGQVSNNVFIYDDFFRTKSSADLWGADFVLLFNSYLPKPSLQVRPLVGFRYLDYGEQLVQTGSFDQLGNLTVPLISTISSTSDNQSYVPQIGVRIEMPSRWVTVGLEPRIGAGVSTFDNLVFSEALRSVGDPRVTTTDQGEKISVSGELTIYGKLHLHPSTTLHVGYTIMGVTNISRAGSNLRYNDNGPQELADITVQSSFERMYFQGLNVGGEIRF